MANLQLKPEDNTATEEKASSAKDMFEVINKKIMLFLQEQI